MEGAGLGCDVRWWLVKLLRKKRKREKRGDDYGMEGGGRNDWTDAVRNTSGARMGPSKGESGLA